MSDALEIETDTFVSPKAKTDLKADDAIDLELDDELPSVRRARLAKVSAAVCADPNVTDIGKLHVAVAVACALASAEIDAPPKRHVCGCPLGTRGAKRSDGTCETCLLPRKAPANAPVARVAAEASVAPDAFSAIAQESASNAAARQARSGGARAFSTPQARAESDVERARILNREQVVAGAVASGSGELVCWDGLGDLTNARLRQLAQAAGIQADWVLTPESAKAQAARAVKLLRKKGIAISVVNKAEEVERGAEAVTYASRWTVGRVDHRAKAGESLGNALLVATLEMDGTLLLEGDETMKRTVREEFDRRIAAEVHRSTDITVWLATTLRFRLGAVKFGKMWYAPMASVAMARRLCAMLENAGWGTEWVGGEKRQCPVATTEQLCDGLLLGLAEEVDAELQLLETRRAQIRSGGSDNATKDIGERAAGTFISKLRTIGERIVGYGALLGEKRVATLRERVRVAMMEVDAQVDSGISQRFGLIWEEIELDQKRAASAA